MFYFLDLFSLRRRDDVTIDCGKSALSSRVAAGSPSLINHLLAAYDSLWIRLKDKSSICKHIRMTSTATTNPSDLYQILFHFPIICHHSHRNSLFSAKISPLFFLSLFFFQLEGTKRGGQTGVAFVLVPLRLPPLPLSFSCLPSVVLWCDYYTFSRGFNHGPVGPSPRGGPDFNARVLLFPPVYCLAFYSARQSH